MPPVPAGNKHAERFWEARLRWSRCSETRRLSGAVPAAGGARGGGGAARLHLPAPSPPSKAAGPRGPLPCSPGAGAESAVRSGRGIASGLGIPAGGGGGRGAPGCPLGSGACGLARAAQSRSSAALPRAPVDPEAEVSGGASPWQRAEAEGAALMAAAGGAALWRRLAAWLPRGPPGLAALLGRLSDRLSRGRDRRSRR